MLKNINGLSVFLTFMILLLFGAFYYVIETQERPQSKAEVSRIIRTGFFKNKLQYNALSVFALQAHSRSSDWYFDNRSGDSLQFVGEDLGAPDFERPAGLRNTMDSLQLDLLRYQNDEVCDKRSVTFTLKSDLFSPDGRVVYFRYFPDGMCKEMIASIRRSDNKWNWSFFLDKNWVAQSVKRKH